MVDLILQAIVFLSKFGDLLIAVPVALTGLFAFFTFGLIGSSKKDE